MPIKDDAAVAPSDRSTPSSTRLGWRSNDDATTERPQAMENATGTVSHRSMPRAAGLPLVGSLPRLLVNPLQFLERSLARHGTIFELDLGVTRAVVVADAAAVEYVLLKNARNFDKVGPFWEGIRDLVGLGLGTSEGAVWRRQRKMIQPNFQPGFLERFRGTIAKAVEGELDGLRSDGPIDVSRWCDRLLETLVVRILFGSELEESHVDELRTTMAAVSDAVIQGLVTRKLPRWLPVPGRDRLERARRVFDERVTELIAERRRHPGGGDDLLALLVGATDELGAMTDEQLLDEAITFYVSGYETTGTALAWTLWLVGTHPRIRDELHAELDSGSEEAPLLRACIQEGLRLYPPALFIGRHTLADDEIGGHRVAAGTTVLASPWLVHRNPELWPRPTEFDPGRFMDPKLVAERPRLAWIPFGAGQRTCVGKALALLELEEGLRAVLRRFTPMVAENRSPPKPKLSTVLRSTSGIYLCMQPR
jgi:cytochrome P450